KWLAFYFDAENDFTRGPLGFASHIVCILMMVALLGILFTRFRARSHSDTFAIFFCALACCIAMVVETITTRSGYLPTTIIIACVFYYLFLHTQITRAETMEKELLLSDQRAAMTVSDLKPRFIYDVLGNLKGLPTKDPQRAETALNDLLVYLEMNMEETDFLHPVPFLDELDRTQKYLKIEQARLPHLRVSYEIEDTDFLIPALTVQQMVENGIRHGMDNNDKGTIVIKSFGSESGHTVIIQDNGKGFETEAEMNSENQGSRFGIANVTDRLQRMVGGDLNIVSSKDVGTTVMISIPNN
ncbi:MAG: histidine kinase, partial [Clostridia bacterium]|nr:histidine kinase [Clostridia bacterium]